MNSEQLRAAQAPFKQQYQQNPSDALIRMVARGKVNVPSLTVEMEYSGPKWTTTGMHPKAGGDGLTACAAEMLLHSLAGCAGVSFSAVATVMEIPLDSVFIRVEGDVDFRGTLGIARDVPVGFSALRVIFEIQSAAPDAKLSKLVELAERYCVVAQSLKNVSATWERVD